MPKRQNPGENRPPLPGGECPPRAIKRPVPDPHGPGVMSVRVLHSQLLHVGPALRHDRTPDGFARRVPFESRKQVGMRACHNPAVARKPTAQPTEAAPHSPDRRRDPDGPPGGRQSSGVGGMLARSGLGFMLEPGSAAPDFTITLLSGGEFTLSDLRGSRVVLFFFPGALTPG